MKTKLHVYTLEHSDNLAPLFGGRVGWVLKTEGGSLVETYTGCTKDSAVAFAAGRMKCFLDIGYQHSELRIRNLNGTFAPARTYPRSADPRRSKG